MKYYYYLLYAVGLSLADAFGMSNFHNVLHLCSFFGCTDDKALPFSLLIVY